ncbi:MAG: hypothetical protein IJW51_06595 [Clostridia bacterium]|nr:hypothetical protein [Clostridia bacterium]
MAKRRKGRGVRRFLQLIAIFMLSSLLVGILSFEAARTEAAMCREAATLTTLSRTVCATGYVFRQETVVTSAYSGPVLYGAADGTALVAGDTLASVYVGTGGTSLRDDAAVLQAEIARLQALDATGPVPDYYGAYTSLMSSLSCGNTRDTAEAKATLQAALSLHAVQGTDAALRAAKIAQLQVELEKIIPAGTASETVKAPVDGVFYANTDGYETVFSFAALDSLTPGGLRALLASPQDTAAAVGKLVCPDVWYLAVPADGERAAAFLAGNTYTAHLARTNETVMLTLDRITDADAEGELLLIFRATGHTPPADMARCAEVEIVTGSVTGLWVPQIALREEDGSYGVLVDHGGVAAYRKIEPLLMQDGYCLAAQIANEAYLQTGEWILVTHRRIYSGKALK